ncbi:serine hydrolase domain-containing protein [Hamadaea tsunoensis]|uniref:serine hydrolase domain-containing protein n=1 Tax=Hamadaea tsunoensis TaxID=53368 RepID=UPI0003FC5D5F|nr:serine hydrolase domain-containing protein [Hamadaea tsunoensis]
MELHEVVTAVAAKHRIPGAAVGVLVDGREHFAAAGVTDIENPLPIDEHTLFPIASVTKSFTATALMRLAAEGKVDLNAPVRTYVPELRLSDPDTTERVTVLHLLNHTAGLEWNLIDPDPVEDTLAAFVAKLAGLKTIAPVGARVSYSQAGYNLAGRVIEKVTGMSYEESVGRLVLRPAGLADTVFAMDDVARRRHATGYNRDDDGTPRPATSWKGDRGNHPGGGAASTTADLLRWARVQLGDDPAVRRMQEPTAELRASTLGDAMGICWFIKDIGGVRTIGHGGSGNGQFSDLLIVPGRGFAVVSLANCGPDGYLFNQAITQWALEHYLGVVEQPPQPVAYDEARAREAAGRYEIDVMNLDVATDGERMTLAVGIKPEIRAASETEMPADYPAAAMGFLPSDGDGDEYVITDGGLAGQRGYFTRSAQGVITGIDLAGRLFTRIP